jgi:hypothetical protein
LTLDLLHSQFVVWLAQSEFLKVLLNIAIHNHG